ncbi:AMP-binding enzyme [Nocardia sp. KC 131]|uniref:AMP-binding enzyme n=1 Tax=Nocardia arseniciresistens TaxID=3392119 RepID=UPI00398EB360
MSAASATRGIRSVLRRSSMYPGAHVDRFPDKVAIVMAESGATLTYRQLEENSIRLARDLHDAGLRRGDHVALLSVNDPKIYEVYWAALRSGLYITAVNWHLTPAEIGYIDEDGYLFLTDRKAFTIISGGVNIYPQEIENALALHPKVFDVAVIGVPDQEVGESVKAVVQPAAGVAAGPALAEELREFLEERIGTYKVPRTVDFSDDPPRTPTGKLVKGKLRARYL